MRTQGRAQPGATGCSHAGRLARFGCYPLSEEQPLIQQHTLPLRRYEMRDVLAIESAWLTELAPHMYRLVPLNPQLWR